METVRAAIKWVFFGFSSIAFAYLQVALSLGTPVQPRAIQHNSSGLVYNVQFYMFISEVAVKGGGVLDYIILKGVSKFLTSLFTSSIF